MSKVSVLSGLATSTVRVAARRVTGRRLRPGWSFGFEVFADALKRSERRIRELPPSAQGEAWERRSMPHPVLKQARFESTSVNGVPAEWVIPNGDATNDVVLYLHGGWYSSASPRNYRELVARLCVAARTRALVLDYRLAPAHPFPAAVDDTLAAWRWLESEGHAPDRIVVAGDSAGGGLATSLMLSLRDAKERLPAGAILLSPWVDLAATGGSLVDNAPFDWSDPDEVVKRARMYLGDHDPKTALASPIFADLAGLPPMLVQVGGAEMLLDQATRFAERAKQAGVNVTLQVADDMIHDWHLFAALFPHARSAIDAAATFARARLDQPRQAAR